MAEERFDEILEGFEDDKAAEEEARSWSVESENFIYAKGGQWTQSIFNALTDKPRYQFDIVSSAIKKIMSDIYKTDFDISCLPGSSDADDKVSNVYDGIIRNIRLISNTQHIFNSSVKTMAESGFECWRVMNGYKDEDCYDQDIWIEGIGNSKQRVWFDCSSKLQTREDANRCTILTKISREEFESFKTGRDGQSLSDNRTYSVYGQRDDHVIIGERIYKSKAKAKDLIYFNNGMVAEDDDQLAMVYDELRNRGIEATDRRKRKKTVIKRFHFDAQDRLDDEEELLWSYIPIIPIYANFKYSENKVLYFGEVMKLFDPQRLLNWSVSEWVRQIALSPNERLMGTEKQLEPMASKLSTLHTDNACHLVYGSDPEAKTPPYYARPSGPNPSIQAVIDTSKAYIQDITGRYDQNDGKDVGAHSGIAINSLIEQGDSSSYEHYLSLALGIHHTAKIIIPAIPKVYNDRKVIRIIGKDGGSDFQEIRKPVLDEQTNQVVYINDLSVGKYDCVVDIGPSYKNKQEEIQEKMLKLAEIAPGVFERNIDIFLSNVPGPGMKDVTERERERLLLAGGVPESQMTDEEKQKVQQAAQQRQGQQDPAAQAMIMAAQAEMQDAQTRAQESQARIADTMSKIQERQNKHELEMRKLKIDAEKTVVDIKTQMGNYLKEIADTLKALKEATGADAIVDPTVAEVYHRTALEAKKALNKGNGGQMTPDDMSGNVGMLVSGSQPRKEEMN